MISHCVINKVGICDGVYLIYAHAPLCMIIYPLQLPHSQDWFLAHDKNRQVYVFSSCVAAWCWIRINVYGIREPCFGSIKLSSILIWTESYCWNEEAISASQVMCPWPLIKLLRMAPMLLIFGLKISVKSRVLGLIISPEYWDWLFHHG